MTVFIIDFYCDLKHILTYYYLHNLNITEQIACLYYFSKCISFT